MPVSRRGFIATLGAGGAGVLAAPLLNWRGRESLQAQQGTQAAPGTPDARRADRLLAARPGVIRIDSNENPNGPGAHVYDVIRASVTDVNRYPVQFEDDLIAAIAKKQGVSASNIALGCGSSELLRAAVRAYTSPEHALVSPQPTFELPAEHAKLIGTPVVEPHVDAKIALDLDAILAAARGAGLVYFCNPNNPTASVHGHSDVAAFVERSTRQSPTTTILIDEAYHEYVADPAYGTAIPLALSNPAVIVTRTFSKVFGMAGLRVGYVIGQPATIARMRPWILGSSVNQLALVAATATIGDAQHIAAEQQRNRETRAFTKAFFETAGYKVPAADANFMMVDIRRDAKAFKQECLKHNVAVGRAFPALPTHTRVTVGTMAEMKRAVQVFHDVLAQPASR